MKTIFRLTIASLALAMITIATFPARGFADTAPQSMPVSCTAPNSDHQTGLHRPKGDGNIWTFQVTLEGGARFVKGPFWSFPGKNGNDPDWGLVTGGADGDSSMNWSSPGKTGDFQVRVNGQISCGDGPGNGEPIDFSAGWDGTVDYNAEIKVKRSGTPEADYSTSATVAAGGLGSSEHKADVVVIATDDDGNPMEGITVDTPTIQDGDGVDANASISAVNATTDEDGKAYFTFTSSDILGSVTLEEDGGESSASASIEQDWTNLPDGSDEGESWEFDPYFDYDVASNVTFKMALESNGDIPITGHDIQFETTQVSGWEWYSDAGEDWDGDGYPDGDYLYMENQDYDDVADWYGELVTHSSASKSGGNYTTQQKVLSNDDFWVDVVYFDAVDSDVFD